MAKDLIVGLAIGATLTSGFAAAFAGARSTLGQLGKTVEALTKRQDQALDKLTDGARRPQAEIQKLNREYERLGRTIEAMKANSLALATSLERGARLRELRGGAASDIRAGIGMGLAVGAPVVQSVRTAADLEDQVRDIAITGEMDKGQEAALTATIRQSARDWNQAQTEIARGLGIIVAGGIQDAAQLQAYTPIITKAATATRTTMDDLGSVIVAFSTNLGINASGMEGSLNMLTYASKAGQFEFKNMAKWGAQLAPMYAAFGVTGKEAVAEMSAALQIAKIGAGSADEAANNFKNFLAKITSEDTKKDFEKAGINLEGSLMRLAAQGLTPVEGMMTILQDYLKTKAPQAVNELKQAMKIEDLGQRDNAVRALAETYKLGTLFQDMQARSFILPALANLDKLKELKKETAEAGSRDLIGEDFKKRVETANEHMKRLGILFTDIGTTIGNVFLPPLVRAVETIAPLVSGFQRWAEANPAVVRWTVGLAAGLVGAWTAVALLRFGLFFSLGALNGFGTAMIVLRSGALMMTGGLQAAAGGFRLLGVAMVANPIGLVVTAIVAAVALLAVAIYKYWEPLKGWVVGFWQGLKEGAAPLAPAFAKVEAVAASVVGAMQRVWGWFSRLLEPVEDVGGAAEASGRRIGLAFAGIATSITTALQTGIGFATNFVGTVTGLFDGMLRTVGNLPQVFRTFGENLVDGLVEGIRSKITLAQDAVVGVASGVKNWFSGVLGIKSPSRVFMSFGDDIAEGAAIGISRTAPLAARAAAAMAAAAGGAAETGPAGSPGNTRLGGGPAASGGVTVHFNPSITVTAAGGNAGELQGAVVEAARMTFDELERLIRRVTADQQRRAF